MSQTTPIADAVVSATPLAARLARENPVLELKMHRGAQTPLRFAGIRDELRALLEKGGVFDLGYRTFLRAGGKDRVRWLNGMITQNVKGMEPGEAAYTLVLTPQGRIQGDADLFVHQDVMFLETDRSQSERLLSHLRRYIIMDEVQLEQLDAETTALGIAGPRAEEILEKLGAPAPQTGTIHTVQAAEIEVELIGSYSPVVPRYELHVPAARAMDLWNALTAAGATQCGIAAMEDFRVLEGIPRFDVDFSDKHLPQEANLYRALHFTKGCYIGQEIVERIRARATVHRSLRQFALEGTTPSLAAGEAIEVRSGGAAVGELTSVGNFQLPELTKTLALGMVRVEALGKSEAGTEPLAYDGGIAVPVAEPQQGTKF
ncbi:MAG TPA: folate-binding protein [Acidobacteriaceae bacterium]